MAYLLEVLDGPCEGRSFRIEPGQRIVFGRSSTADQPLPEDEFLSKRHFSVECLEDSVRIWDENSRNGTHLNGTRIDVSATAVSGDEISAGGSYFRLIQEGGEEKSEGSTRFLPLSEPREDGASVVAGMTRCRCLSSAERHVLVRRLLAEEEGDLYAIVDGARGAEMPAKLFELGEGLLYHSLFFGTPMNHLVEHAPYLVRLEAKSPLLDWWLEEGWGNAWGILLVSEVGIEALLSHFQELLVVQDEEGHELYFRYYDPRVMEIYWPTCTEDELLQVMGPARLFIVEGEGERVTLFRRPDGAV